MPCGWQTIFALFNRIHSFTINDVVHIAGRYDLVLVGNLDPPGIYVAPTDTFNFTLIPGFDSHMHVRRPVAIDYDPIDGMVYWTDVEHSSISRAFLDGTGSVVLLTGLQGKCQILHLCRIPLSSVFSPVLTVTLSHGW